MNEAREAKDNSVAEGLCRACGLCCNGVIFADVKLQRGDNAERLRGLGLTFKPANAATKFTQPCAAFEGCRCRIYAERPRYCREFECALLKNVVAGETGRAQAFDIVGQAHERVNKVRQLLHELGETEESEPLDRRFRRLGKRLEEGALDEASAGLYGELTLAVQDLNVLLSQAFYPG